MEGGHIHISGISVLTWTFTAMIVLPALHLAAIYLHNTPFGQALAVGI